MRRVVVTGTGMVSPLGCGTEIRPGWELLRWVAGRSPHTLPALGLAVLEKIPKLMPSRGKKLVEAGLTLRAELKRIIGSDGVMLYPSYPTVAPRHVMPFVIPSASDGSRARSSAAVVAT